MRSVSASRRSTNGTPISGGNRNRPATIPSPSTQCCTDRAAHCRRCNSSRSIDPNTTRRASSRRPGHATRRRDLQQRAPPSPARPPRPARSPAPASTTRRPTPPPNSSRRHSANAAVVVNDSRACDGVAPVVRGHPLHISAPACHRARGSPRRSRPCRHSPPAPTRRPDGHSRRPTNGPLRSVRPQPAPRPTTPTNAPRPSSAHREVGRKVVSPTPRRTPNVPEHQFGCKRQFRSAEAVEPPS